MGALQRILEHLGALETKHVLFVVFLSLSLFPSLCPHVSALCLDTWVGHGWSTMVPISVVSNLEGGPEQLSR